MEPRICQLDYAAGQTRRCPGEHCPFWVDDHCAIAGLWSDFASSPDLVELLTELRTELASRDPLRPLREFHPPGLV